MIEGVVFEGYGERICLVKFDPLRQTASGQSGCRFDEVGRQVDSRHPATAFRREITGRAAEAATEIEDVHAGPYACMFRMLARCHDTAAVQLVERPQVAVARPLGIDPSGTRASSIRAITGRSP